MALRTLMSPGVEIHEIDKSGYTPTMAGTAVYLKGFSPKGEAYKPFEVTSRSAFEQIFGTPDTEAERYFYAGACETLNQGGRLFAARLPYDNASFEKMVGIKYTVACDYDTLSNNNPYEKALLSVDSELHDAAFIEGGKDPALYELSDINLFRADEAKVPANSFLIIDTTGATYGRVMEDTRRGQKREVIGIIPVVTTAANALYVQKYIKFDPDDSLSVINKFEALCGDKFKTLIAKDATGQVLNIDRTDMENDGLLSLDLVSLIATDSYFTPHETLSVNVLRANEDFNDSIVGALNEQGITCNNLFGSEEDADKSIKAVSEQLVMPESIFSVSAIVDGDATYYSIVSAGMVPVEVTRNNLYGDLSAELSANGYDLDDLSAQFGYHGKDMDDSVPDTIALDAANYFPPIQPAVDGEGLDPEHLKDIGVVVYKAYLDPAEGNKVSVEPVEAYAGSLFKDDKDPNTGVTKFIDTIINSQSRYINFFSNCFNTSNTKKFYKDVCDILIAKPSVGACLGLYTPMTKKDISISKSILDGMNKCFDKVEDVNKLDIDIVPDAGLANIASYIMAIFGEKGPYDLAITDDLGNSLLGMWQCKKATDKPVKMWKTVLMKHDNFCKNVRKDCMFVADGMRPLVLQGQKKIVRETMPSNSIDKDILPYLPAICGLNTSYGAGYMDWFEQADDYTGDFFWVPPSIKATGIYINTDLNYDYWLAPAGLTRGIVAATDVAFSPTSKQSGPIYQKNWNYAVNYPQDGIILEGQKTFQTKPTALDRVNVRRTMLRLERAVYKIARYFVYENNTAYTRQRIVDAIEPIMKACCQGGNGGIQRYKIVCDESNNTPNTIDNNELHVAIGVVPTKSIEFLMVDFILGSQGSTWAELF